MLVSRLFRALHYFPAGEIAPLLLEGRHLSLGELSGLGKLSPSIARLCLPPIYSKKQYRPEPFGILQDGFAQDNSCQFY